MQVVAIDRNAESRAELAKLLQGLVDRVHFFESLAGNREAIGNTPCHLILANLLHSEPEVADWLEALSGQDEGQRPYLVAIVDPADRQVFDDIAACGIDDFLEVPVSRDALRSRLTLAKARIERQYERASKRPAVTHDSGSWHETFKEHRGIVPWESDADTGEFVSIGPQVEDLLGHPASSWMEGGFWASHIHPQDRDRVLAQRLQPVIEPKSYMMEYRFRDSEGRFRWICDAVADVLGPSGTRLRHGFLFDVTDARLEQEALTRTNAELKKQVNTSTQRFKLTRKLLEKNIEQLDLSEARFRQVVETAQEGIWILDLEGRINFVNRRMAQIFRCRAEDLLGRPPWDFVDEERKEEVKHRFELSKKNVPSVYDFPFRTMDGELIWTLVASNALVDRENRFNGALFLINDITERKAAETALIEAREAAEAANRAKSEFLNMMSHEIRTPLNSIIGFSELLAQSDLSEEQREFGQIISNSGRHLLELINNILDVSKIEAGKVELETQLVNPMKSVEGAAAALALKAESKGLTLGMKTLTDVPHFVLTDPVRLRQILTNLIGNAVKFTETGGVTVKVAAKPIESEPRWELTFHVSDTGVGIPPEKMDRLFKPFSQGDSSITRKYGGTGLGLVISQRLCELMGGKMWVESTPGVGSTFSFTISTEAVASDNVEEISDNEFRIDRSLGKRHSLRILVAEDTKENQILILQFLRRMSLDAEVVSTGAEAMERLRNQVFDLLLVDINIPDVSGYEIARAIRDGSCGVTASDTSIVAVTASTLDDGRKLEAMGIDDFVSKPIDLARLQACLQRIIDRRELAGHTHTTATGG